MRLPSLTRPQTFMAAAGVIALLSFIELLLANRKFGLFTGGFGQSRAVDAPAEIALFAIGYVCAQAFIGIIAWALIARLNRSGSNRHLLFHFIFAFGGIFAGIMALRYQLASYFSDAMSFGLLKQLGGGSLGDAILYGLNEITLGVGALLLIVLAYWLVWRWVRRHPGEQTDSRTKPSRAGWKTMGVAALSLAIALFIIPRSGGDAAFGLNRTQVWSAGGTALDTATDFDRDGYGLAAIIHDDHPFDAARHPLALDIPGNGVDEDGFGGDLKLVPVPEQPGAASIKGERPNLVIVVMESTRGDVLGKRVNGREVAPHLNVLAAGGSAASSIFSHVGFTTESLKSLFSGSLLPQPGSPSLFRDLDESGYRIGVFSGQPEDFGGISETVGMRDAADIYVDAESLKEKRAFSFAAQGSLLVAENHLLAAFDESFGTADDWQRPVFAYFNFQTPHFPYAHDEMPNLIEDNPIVRSAISAKNADHVRRSYWNAVAAADYWLGELIDRLKARGEWDNTLLVVTGDHGEELFDDGFLGHGHRIGKAQNETFLVVNRPGVAPAGPLGLSDLRGIILSAMAGEKPVQPDLPPFLQIGPLDEPTAIGLAADDGTIVSIRLDTHAVCFQPQNRCTPYDQLSGDDLARADAVVARWGSERWARRAAR